MSEMKSSTRCRAFHTSVDLSAEQTGRIGDATGRQQAKDDQRWLHNRCLHEGRNYTPLGVCDQRVETPHLVISMQPASSAELIRRESKEPGFAAGLFAYEERHFNAY